MSIVVPAFNEAATIEGVVRRVAELPLRSEIVVVDDGSRDATPEILARLQGELGNLRVERQENRGKGAAVRHAIALSEGDFVVVQDADLEYDPHELPRLVSRVASGEADVVYGSRFARGRAGFPFWHTLANRMLTAFSNAITGLPVSDMETCYKVMRTDVVRDLPLREERFGFEPEVTALLAHLSRRRRLRVVEEPISYSPRSLVDGKKIRLKDAFRAVYCIVRYGLAPPSWPRDLPARGEVRPAE